jgi:hypothetical protein
MAQSGGWDQWYSEFAATWNPPYDVLIDRTPAVELRGSYIWMVTRQYVPVPQQVLNRFCQPSQDDISWFVAALQDERRWFVARMAKLAGSVPEALFEPMVLSAVEAEDPSLNALLIKPCVQSCGALRVNEYLIALVADSADARRVVGADDATYWTGHSHRAVANTLFERRKLFLLEACFSGISTYVRHRILALLTGHGTRTLDASLVPESHRELVTRAQALWDDWDEVIGRGNK